MKMLTKLNQTKSQLTLYDPYMWFCESIFEKSPTYKIILTKQFTKIVLAVLVELLVELKRKKLV